MKNEELFHCTFELLMKAHLDGHISGDTLMLSITELTKMHECNDFESREFMEIANKTAELYAWLETRVIFELNKSDVPDIRRFWDKSRLN